MSVDGAAIDALQARGRFGIRLGLGRTRALLRALGSPEAHVRGALIGGTNGKGSTQAIVGSVLRASGMRVGQTPKPHLVSYRERIVVDDRPIGATDFAALVDEVLTASARVARRLGPATEFELLTAAALLWFERSRVDVAVVEVGLGGRLDATNTWTGGVSAITNVERDHMDLLGDTITAIAREKAAIIKRGDRAVTGAGGDALAVVRRRAARMGVPLTVAQPLRMIAMDRAGTILGGGAMDAVRLGLLGRHQGANAAVALAVLVALSAAGIAQPDEVALRRGLAEVRWPGRLELLSVARDGTGRPAAEASPAAPDPAAPDVLLDGAHNVAGARALAQAVGDLRLLLSPGRPVLLLGILRDKEVELMVEALKSAPALRAARVITTDVPDTTRTLPAADLATLWGRGATAAGHVDEALAVALEAGRADDGPVIVAGSLYLVGWVRGRVMDDSELLGSGA